MKVISFFIRSSLIIASFATTLVKSQDYRPLRCENPIPGYETFQFGIDATEVDLFSCHDETGKKGLIFDYNWCSKNVFRGKSEIKDYRTGNYTTYSVPDVIYVEPTLETLETGTDMYISFKQFREFLLKNIYLNEKRDKKGIMSSSQTLKKYQAAFDDAYRVIAVHRQFLAPVLNVLVSSVKRDFENYTVDNFKNAVNLLPTKFEGNEDEFLKFIKHYGTHWITGVEYGAIIHRLALIKNKNNLKEIKDKVSVSFPSISEKDEPICSDSKSTNVVVFKNNEMNYEHIFLGGNTSLSITGNYTKWLPSVASIRTPNKLTLEPIASIVNFYKRKALQDAVDAYIAGAYLNETIRFLITLNHNGKKLNYNNTEADSIIQSSVYTNSSTFYNTTTLKHLIERCESEITQINLYISSVTRNQGNVAQNIGINFLLNAIIMSTIIVQYV